MARNRKPERNIALHRAATASSSFDYNLTAQLLTDGIIPPAAIDPVRMDVFADGELLPKHAREWAVGGNDWCHNIVRRRLEYRWHGMSVRADRVRVVATVAYDASRRCRDAELSVCANTASGKVRSQVSWHSLPGKQRRGMLPSDPNKQSASESLPSRLVDTVVVLHRECNLDALKLDFNMSTAAYWRVNQVELLLGDEVVSPLPSTCFCSVWMSADSPSLEHSINIDLGEGARIDSVRYHWVEGYEPPQVRQSFDGRYLKVVMSGLRRVALREVEVLGERTQDERSQAEKASLWQVARATDSLWLPTDVPQTVLGAYIAAGAVPNPDRDDQWRSVSESYFNADFLYRRHIKVSADSLQTHRCMLSIGGVCHSADIYLNAHHLGTVKGAFRRARFDIGGLLSSDGEGELLVCVHPCPHPGAVKEKLLAHPDFNGGVLGADNPSFHATVGWDWIPTVPGRCMGIWDDVDITFVPDVSIADPVLVTMLDDSLCASMTPSVRLINNTSHAVIGRLNGRVGDIGFSRYISLAAWQDTTVSFSPSDYPQLAHQRMRLWWPNGMGEQNRYDAMFTFNGDTLRYNAAVREVTYADVDSCLKIYVNRQRVSLRGGNWGFSEQYLRYTPDDYDRAVRLHRDMHFNMIRNWVGQTAARAFYEACDRYGILVWQDFWLANPADGPSPQDEQMFMDNACDYLLRIRQHPSLALYCGRNEGFPPSGLDSALRRAVSELHPGMLYISSSADGGVSGHGPYRAVARAEYFASPATRLHTERGLPNIMEYESLARVLSAELQWPQNDSWARIDFSLGGAQQGATFNTLVENYGHPTSAESFCQLAQWQNYEGHRAMFEANNLARHGLLMWMSHPCHPSMTWQTYDYFFHTAAAYYAVRKACEPLHIQFDSHSQVLQVVNHNTSSTPSLVAVAELYDADGRTVRTQRETITLAPDTTTEVLRTFALPTDSATYFLRLQLVAAEADATIAPLSINTYLYNATGNDYTDLTHGCGPTDMSVLSTLQPNESFCISNDTDKPMLFIRLRLINPITDTTQEAVFSDNYFHLMPGERRMISVLGCSN